MKKILVLSIMLSCCFMLKAQTDNITRKKVTTSTQKSSPSQQKSAIITQKTPSATVSNKASNGKVISTSPYVDLGLSSGTYWAGNNVGAAEPQQFGIYFQWGETSPSSQYSELEYSSSRIATEYSKDKLVSFGAGNDDAATIRLGIPYSTPTPNQLYELYNDCKWEWTTFREIWGMCITGPNGKSIFIPAGGDYVNSSLSNVGDYGVIWSCTLNEEDDTTAYCVFFSKEGPSLLYGLRYNGLNIRPVYLKAYLDYLNNR